MIGSYFFIIYFFFNDTATTEIYTLSLHDALPIYPGGQQGLCPLASKEGRDGGRVTPIAARPTASKRSEDGDRANGLLDRLGDRGHLCMEQRAKPRFIEQHLLMRRVPEGADLLRLATERKSLPLGGQDNERFEVLRFVIREACFPF